jgi:ABC-type ATPase with predicted acetyltransferase domain
LLHVGNFDDLVLEHRSIYNEGIPVPFYFLGVLVMEDSTGHTNLDQIKVRRNDPARYEGDFNPEIKMEAEFESLTTKDKEIFQCHQCGNLVDANGVHVDQVTRAKQIALLETYKDRIFPIGIDVCQPCTEEYEKGNQ